MQELISEDSFATLLLCTYVKPQEKIVNEYKPFTQKEWITLSTKIAKSDIARPSSLFNRAPENLIDNLRITANEADRIITLLARGPSMALEVETFASMGIWIITRADDGYPKRLKKILKSLSPNILYGVGDINILGNESIGIVGSRNANDESLEFTKHLSTKAISEGYTVISGGSKGVDSAAHQAAIDSGGKTVAILSDGLLRFIKNKENLKSIINKQLVAISPYHPNSRFYSYTALERNKYIYGLSKATFAISSDLKKGGTWAGAIENIKNNWVPLYVRQDEKSKGLIELVKLGANKISIESLRKGELRQLLEVKPIVNHVDEGTAPTKSSEVYNLVWPLIEKHLNKPISVIKLGEILELEMSQLFIWVQKAKSEGKIKYIDINTVVSTVFYNEDVDEPKQINLFE